MRRKECILLILLLLILLLPACSSMKAGTGESKEKIVAQIREKNPQKIVSLAPSVTEIICAVGGEENLVGRTDYCNYPASVTDIPSIGSYTSPNVELIVQQSPDLVIASQSINEDVQKQLEQIGISVYVTKTSSVEDIKEEILNVGKLLHKEEKAEEVVDEMNEKSAQIEAWKKEIPEKKSVFCDLGRFYTCSSGSFMEKVMEDIGLRNIAAGSGMNWIQLSAELVVQGNPDVYISFYTSADELRNDDSIASLDCLKNGGLIVLDYEMGDILQREGPRIVDGELNLMKMIYNKE